MDRQVSFPRNVELQKEGFAPGWEAALPLEAAAFVGVEVSFAVSACTIPILACRFLQ